MKRRTKSGSLSREEEQQGVGEKAEIPKGRSLTESRFVLLGFLLAFRMFNALLIRTSFNPDEYWQSAEVAHRIVFGYGHLTWEWRSGLRSYVHPLLFAGLYKLMAFFNLDTQWLVVKAPRLLQAVFAATGDYYLFGLARQFWGEQAARWTLVNWFSFFCMVRTFSNSLETVLTIAALYFWFLDVQCSPFATRQVALFLAALACSIRPTNAIIWIYVGIVGLVRTRNKIGLLFEAFLIGILTIGVTSLVDWWMYRKWTFVPLNFMKFNLFSSGGDYYGTHPWHWYFSQGFPVMAFTFLPLLLLGIWQSQQWHIAGLMIWVLSIYSFLGHKEFRFVLPILPLAMMFAGYALSCIEHSCKQQDAKGKSYSKRQKMWFQASVVGLLMTNIPMAIYMCTMHQGGSEAVMHYLSNEVHSGNVKSVMFLMPCHSTPFYSFLHANIPMHFLDCTPSDEIGYVDEADRFFANPEDFLLKMFQAPKDMPSHLVLFSSLEDSLSSILKTTGYNLVHKIFHAHFAVDHGLQKYVVVYVREGDF